MCLQDTELDVVAGIKSILKSSTALRNLAKTDPMQWATVKLVQDRMRSSEDAKSLHNYDIAFQQSSIHQALDDLIRLDAKNMQENSKARKVLQIRCGVH